MATRKKMNTIKSKLLGPYTESSFKHYNNLVFKKPEEINNMNTIAFQLWTTYTDGNFSYFINRCLLNGGILTYSTNSIIAENEKNNLDNCIYVCFNSIVDGNAIGKDRSGQDITSEIIIPGLVKMGLSEADSLDLSKDIISDVKREIKARFNNLSDQEKIELTAKLFEDTFGFKGTIGIDSITIPLIHTTTENELFYRGLGNIDEQDFINKLTERETTLSFSSVTSLFGIASYHAVDNDKTNDQSKNFVLKMVCDAGIGIVNMKAIYGERSPDNWQDEYILPIGIRMRYEGTEEISDYEYSVINRTQKEKPEKIKVLTVRVLAPESESDEPDTKRSRIETGGRRSRRSKKRRRSKRRRKGKKMHTRKH